MLEKMENMPVEEFISEQPSQETEMIGTASIEKTEKEKSEKMKNEMSDAFNDGYETLCEIASRHGFPESAASEYVQEYFTEWLRHNFDLDNVDESLKTVKRDIEALRLPPDMLQNNMVQSAASRFIANTVLFIMIEDAEHAEDKEENENCEKAINGIKEIFLSDPKIYENTMRDVLVEKMLGGSNINTNLAYAERIARVLHLPSHIETSARRQALTRAFEEGLTEYAIELLGRYSLNAPAEIPDEIKNAAREKMHALLEKGKVAAAANLKNVFEFNLSPQELIERSPAMQNLLLELKGAVPKLYEQAQRSADVVFSLFNFVNEEGKLAKLIDDYPFLEEAIENNMRFGSKLLLKFPEYDGASRENIAFLFQTKEDIMTQYPDINPESSEFRKLMQEKLMSWKNNSEIIGAAAQHSLNTEVWLSYGVTRRFALDSKKETLVTTESVSASIARLQEAINIYTQQTKRVLGEYQKEFSAYKVPLNNAKEIRHKKDIIEKELARAREIGDEKKAQGIAKGIEDMDKKLENPETVALWNKIMNDMVKFQQALGSSISYHQRILEAEKGLQEASLSGDAGAIVRHKEKLGSAQEEFRLKYRLFLRRIRQFNEERERTIALALGEDRASALEEEIRTGIRDRTTQAERDAQTLNMFLEQGSEMKTALEGRLISAFVWARNPDIDLYQGNYSPCCISIERGYHEDGGESTIADYATDLGVQIVNLWDEARGEPITAAWCWLGVDEEGTTALVVDNIESNTKEYSVHYPDQLGKELLAYLQEYAETIGVRKLVLGTKNNDLPVPEILEKFADDPKKYRKLGGSNRINGYFLEAEDKKVKTIWEQNP